jgi:nucleoside-diphosphate-sugar epimerase
MSTSPKTIFLTGGTGLVGSHVAEEALARGHRVRALVRPSSDTAWLDRLGVEKVPGDLADADALRRGVEGADWVINCAAKVGDWGTLEEFRKLNVDALRLLLDAAAEAGVARLVHVSSLGVYEGRDHFGTDETTPPALNSLDAYTRSKTEAEVLALAYLGDLAPQPIPLDRLPYVQEVRNRSAVPRPRLPVAIVRPGFIYGERDRTVLPKLVARLRSKVFAYFGSGNQVLNCIYVKNLVHGIFLAAEAPGAVGQVFNLTDGARVTKRQFVGRVAELAGLRPPRRKIPRWLAYTLAVLMERGAKRRGATEPPMINKARYKFLGLNLDYSIERARKVLGYEPPYTTEQGLEAAMADLLARESPRAPAEPVAAR